MSEYSKLGSKIGMNWEIKQHVQGGAIINAKFSSNPLLSPVTLTFLHVSYTVGARFSKVSKRFSTRDARSEISNLMLIELFYSQS